MSFTKSVVSALYAQMSVGCNSFKCNNKECKSCKNFAYDFQNPNQVAKKAVDLAAEYRLHLCSGMPPGFMQPELYTVSENFTATMEKIIKGNDSFDKESATSAIAAAFSSPEQLEYLFLTNDKPITKTNFSFDDELIESVSDAIYAHGEFFMKFKNQFSTVFRAFLARNEYTYHSLRAFYYLPAFRFYFDDDSGQVSPLFPELMTVIESKFPPEVKAHFFTVLTNYPCALRGYLQMSQIALTLYLLITIEDHPPFRDQIVLYTQRFLFELRKSNMQSINPIPSEKFYNDPYSDQFLNRMAETRELNMEYVYDSATILNLEVKCEILGIVLARKQNEEARNALISHFVMGSLNINPNDLQLVVEVDRANLLSDAMNAFTSIPTEQLSRRLQVKFKGEDAIDVGGVSREFFYLITAELFNPDHGMFALIDNRYYWFTPASMEAPMLFNLLGTIIGLAIYNRVILPIRFPVALFKKLQGISMSLLDLKEIDEAVYNSLNSLIDMKKNGYDVSETGLVFTGTYVEYGETKNEDLIEGGSKIEVTNQNLDKYVEAYVNWKLNLSIDRTFSAFKRGFDKLCDRDFFHLFLPDELQIIVSGEEVYDWAALKSGTKYLDGYEETSKTIVMFWEVFEQLTEKQKIDFLLFSTGTDKSPVGGLEQTHLSIQRSGDPTKLPVAHTCFNIFALPDYQDKEQLKKCLLIALENANGFGLK